MLARLIPLLSALLCTACTTVPAVLVPLEATSVIVFGRGLGDIGVSAISGRDCSIVRLDRGQTYCTPIEAPAPELFCTRSLATPDCWASPALLPTPRSGIADTPPATPVQERYRLARWPKSLTAD